MKTKKMSLANIQGKLNRGEMKNIWAGVVLCGSSGYSRCYCVSTATVFYCCNSNRSQCVAQTCGGSYVCSG